MTIILDMGSGETCKNDTSQVMTMIDSVDRSDYRNHEIILKWQLFRQWGELRPLHHGVFAHAYQYAREAGYQTTASVFDYESLKFLREFSVPFVKIACVPQLLSLAQDVRDDDGYWRYPVVASFETALHRKQLESTVCACHLLACIRQYPAPVDDYEEIHAAEALEAGISDHTDHNGGYYLLDVYKPQIYETHFCLGSQTGPDTGPFALRPDQLRDMLRRIDEYPMRDTGKGEINTNSAQKHQGFCRPTGDRVQSPFSENDLLRHCGGIE